ncbi:MAG: hypothetical protein ACOCQY_00175 [Halorhabdus sp.]
MSDSDTTSEALQRVRDRFEVAAAEAEEMSEKARREVTEAIDNLEERIDDDGTVTYHWLADDPTVEPDYEELLEAVRAT